MLSRVRGWKQAHVEGGEKHRHEGAVARGEDVGDEDGREGHRDWELDTLA